ncbi:MAG: hypothetical protein K9K66_09715 [Desulfarculaceae bacterium]|nr:hypothetical protein [Desulfarculaceae bacterium]MCF8073684.1 hypothetical protein [Desulfarculaceae bacterium]MCF8101925.1 hypothetical protein [Desulfarculaceae bacterium]MCF8117652.1 hypothetical protein [Desulfarculaceae bacterium]
MIEFIQTLPHWVIYAGAMLLGILLAVGGGLLFALWIKKLAAKLPERE